VHGRRPAGRREFEAGKLERRRDDAAEETPVSEGLSRLPSTCRYYHLRPLARRQVAAEPIRLYRVAVGPDGHANRRAGVVAPDLRRVQLMPVTALAGAQQKVSTAHTPAAAVGRDVRIDLPVVTTLGMWLELENADDLVGSRVRRHFDLHVTS